MMDFAPFRNISANIWLSIFCIEISSWFTSGPSFISEADYVICHHITVINYCVIVHYELRAHVHYFVSPTGLVGHCNDALGLPTYGLSS